jgi:hypothetical protein
MPTRSFRDVLNGFAPTVPAAERLPRDVLADLAETLTDRAKPKMYVDVETTTTVGGKAINTPTAVVARLDDYVLQLLTVSHAVLAPYPVMVSGMLLGTTRTVQTEDELFDALAAAAGSGEFARIYGVLMAQA